MNGSRLLAALLVCLLPSAALAQDEHGHEAHAPAPVRSGVGGSQKQVDTLLAVHARALMVAIQQGNVEALTLLSKVPFYFEGQQASTADELKKGWLAALQGKSLESTQLFDIELLTPEEMTEKYGRPPERLANWPLKGAMVSIANLDGHPVVVLWRRAGQGWQALAFHD